MFSLWLPGCGASTPPPQAGPKETSSATELFRLGQEAAAQGDTVRAEQYLSMALDRGFDAKKVLPIMLRVCLSSNRLRAALNHAEPYLREHPNDQGLRYLVATIHLSLGQIEQARIGLNHLLRVNPKNGDAHYLLGVLEATGSNLAAANGHFLEYLKLTPKGEHATEVKSRLTDLSVRTDLDALVAVHDEAAPSQHVVVRPLRATIEDVPSGPNAAWFGDAPVPTTAVSTEGERP